jgi:hypothetical protein
MRAVAGGLGCFRRMAVPGLRRICPGRPPARPRQPRTMMAGAMTSLTLATALSTLLPMYLRAATHSGAGARARCS